MSSRPQSTSGPSSGGIPVPPDPTPIFEQHQAKRVELAAELEARRREYLACPTIESLEAFVEKKVECSKVMRSMVEYFRSAVHEHQLYVEAKGRAAKLAEERRLEEFQRALEGMNPAEAEAAMQAERERASRLQKEHEARAVELDAKIERARACHLEKYPLDDSWAKRS